MKVLLLFVVAFTGSVLCAPEAPVAPYAPSGWRPKGPAFELPSRNTETEVPDSYRTPKEEQSVDITEEEIKYTGELGTTESVTVPFQEYGPPELNTDEEITTPASDAEDGLTVQGLPATEPAKEFRVLPSERLKDGRTQKLRAQQRQKTARLQAPQPQFQRQQVASFSGFQAPNQFGVGIIQTGQRNGKTFGQSVTQFGRLVQAPRPVAVFQPTFFQRQELAADPTAVPAQEYGPAKEYGPPLQAFGPPAQEPQEEGDIDAPEQPLAEPELPQQEEEDTTELNDGSDETGEGVVAISNAVSSERYTQRRQSKAAKLRASGPAPKLRIANLRQFNEPVYTFNQFGQLVRIY